MPTLMLDTETFCETDLAQYGSYRYSEKVEIMLVSWAVGTEPVQLWDKTKEPVMPSRLREMLLDPKVTVTMHNGGGFDRLMIEQDLKIVIPPERIHDTMARALSHGFPGGLDILCDILKPPVSKAKDKSGKKLIHRFCKPAPKNSKIRRFTRLTHPEEWEKFCEYAKLDIEAMRWLLGKLPLWNYNGYELGLWHRDQAINKRGVRVDIDLCNAALRAVERDQKNRATKVSDLTLGVVESTQKRDKLLKYILEMYGVGLPDMQASTLERRIEDPDLPKEVKWLLHDRLKTATTSTAKYKRFLKLVSSDGRLRGTLQFSGAPRTKRWAGRGVQLQNLPRPSMKAEEIEFGIKCMKEDCEDIFFDNVMDLARNAVRGCLIPGEGKKFYISDLSNIEGRFAAWLAAEKWKLEAFKAFDEGKGPDLYKVAYAAAFKIRCEDVTKENRQVGKVMELMLQYQGGVGAFVTGALTYGIDLDELATRAWPEIPQDVREEAEAWWAVASNPKRGKPRTLGLERPVFTACDGLKRLWRRAHPNIVSTWEELANAARNAIESKNKIYKVKRLSFERKGNWLRMTLPSGYYLCYPGPRVDDKGDISYLGINQYNRKWQRLRTYAGKFFEQSCQAGARDIMAWNMEPVEAHGYDIVLDIHDELITEADDDGTHTHEELSRLLAANPDWSEGLPLAAGGYETHRYRKGD